MTIAYIRGIPIRLHITFLVVVAYLAWRAVSRSGALASWIELTLLGMIFASVVLHELGHAFVAHRHGVSTTSITLYPFGGLARLGGQPPTAAAELSIAAAGPAANLVLAGLVLLLSGGQALRPGESLWLHLASILLWANLIMAAINLVPAFPLDGGRILRSFLARSVGWIKATIWSASIGQVLAIMLIVAGLMQSPWWLLAGLVILPGANLELRRAHLLRSFHAGKVGDVMARHLLKVDPQATLAELTDLSRDKPLLELIVVQDGRALGFLPSARLWAFLGAPEEADGAAPGAHPDSEARLSCQAPGDRPHAEQRSSSDAAPAAGRTTTAGAQSTGTQSAGIQSTVSRLMQPIGAPLQETASVHEALRLMEAAEADAAPVLSSSGELVGVVTRSTLIRVCQRLDAARRDAGDLPWTEADPPSGQGDEVARPSSAREPPDQTGPEVGR